MSHNSQDDGNYISQSVDTPSSYIESLLEPVAAGSASRNEGTGEADESDSALEKTLKKVVSTKIDLMQVSMQDHFIDMKCENEQLA